MTPHDIIVYLLLQHDDLITSHHLANVFSLFTIVFGTPPGIVQIY